MHRRVMNQKNKKYHDEWQTGAFGNDEKNEVRRDIEDAAALAGLDFKIDTVTGRPAGDLYDIYAGDFKQEYREGVKLADKIYGTRIEEKTDICIYLSGDRGKYINSVFWYAPFMTDQATKDDGIVIQVVSGEGGWNAPTGHQTFTPALMRLSTEQMAWNVCGDMEKGVNLRDTACAWQVKKALELKKNFLVTEHENKEFLEAAGMSYVTNSFDDALAKALQEKGKDATISVLYQGGYILPPA
jgi:nickel-dependent lactate racemase